MWPLCSADSSSFMVFVGNRRHPLFLFLLCIETDICLRCLRRKSLECQQSALKGVLDASCCKQLSVSSSLYLEAVNLTL